MLIRTNLQHGGRGDLNLGNDIVLLASIVGSGIFQGLFIDIEEIIIEIFTSSQASDRD